MNKDIRVRFAPSPTGELHIGSLRTALTNFLFARKNDGKFILRVEDTDQKRYVEGSVERLIDSLNWAGLHHDEGLILDEKNEGLRMTKYGLPEQGDYGPYVQSERIDIYKKHANRLLNEGKAYYCFCTPERLGKMREEQTKKGEITRYDRSCSKLSHEEIKQNLKDNIPHVIRFKVPEGKTEVDDLVFGKIEVENKEIDDQVIIKTDGFPTYHLAVVVDDYLMKVSHVFRGAEWLPSTPKHVLLYEALGWKKEMPEFIHMANILNKDRKKLSKREGSVSVEDFKKQGYPPQAIINFIALLGWNPKTEQEIFDMQELIDQFDIAKMNRAGGVFDLDRLDWISSQHIKKMDVEELFSQAVPFIQEKDFYINAPEHKRSPEFIKKILTVEKDRLEKFTQIGEDNKFFFADEVSVAPDDMRWKDSSDKETKINLEKAYSVLSGISEENWTIDKLSELLLEEAGEKRGDLLFPLRAALTGQKKSPSPFEVAWVLGKKETLERLNNAKKIL